MSTEAAASSSPSARPPLWLVPAGALIAFLGSMCGIGGGLFAVPILHQGLGVGLRRSVATALCLVLATTSSSTVTELAGASDLRISLVCVLVAGGLLGVYVGYGLARRISNNLLRAIFVVVLGFASWRILSAGAVGGVPVLEPLGPAQLLVVFLVGIGGGMAAPMLGVGGGLLMVPGLFLCVPGVGFEEARASSLAAGAVASLRSLWLFGRAGLVDWALGKRLASGALVGAALGVWTVASPEWVDVARVFLGGILLLVALRFLVDLVGGKRGGA